MHLTLFKAWHSDSAPVCPPFFFPFLLLLYLLLLLLLSYRDRNGERSSISGLPQKWPLMARAEPVRARRFLQVSYVSGRSPSTWATCAAFPRPLTGSWSKDGAAPEHTLVALRNAWPGIWWLYSLRYSASPDINFFIMEMSLMVAVAWIYTSCVQNSS